MYHRFAQARRRGVLIAIAVCLQGTAWATGLVPTPLRAAIIARSASYERGIAQRSGKLVVAIISGASGEAASDGRAMAQNLDKLLTGSKVASREARVIEIKHEVIADTVAQLRNSGAEVVYVASGLEALLPSLPTQEAKFSRILVCASGADVARGCTLGVELQGDKPVLTLNIAQANAAGLRFDAALLKLAKIVR